VRDCDRAIRLNGQFGKAYKKKSQACINLLRFEEAVEAAKTFVSIEKSVAAKNDL